jgi:hypothetical protein
MATEKWHTNRERGEILPKEVYLCEKCGAQFNTYEECLYHEKSSHVQIDQYGYFEAIHTNMNQTYPEYVLVPFADGSIIKFRSHLMVKEADPVDSKESPLDSKESKED